jgi:hypothetical protein
MRLRGHIGTHVTTERRRWTNRSPGKRNVFRRPLRFPLRFLFRDATVCWLNLDRPLPVEQWNIRENAEHRGDLR